MTENCPMRHENGNCIPAGGFCTANKNICEALLNAYKMGKAQLSQEGTTSDMIDRQKAIDALNEYFARIGKLKRRGLTEGEKAISLDTVGTIKTLPPAQPEPKEGHWIKHESPDGGEQYECSECGVLWEFNDGTPEDNEAFYCPKCGVKMKGEQDGH